MILIINLKMFIKNKKNQKMKIKIIKINPKEDIHIKVVIILQLKIKKLII